MISQIRAGSLAAHFCVELGAGSSRRCLRPRRKALAQRSSRVGRRRSASMGGRFGLCRRSMRACADSVYRCAGTWVWDYIPLTGFGGGYYQSFAAPEYAVPSDRPVEVERDVTGAIPPPCRCERPSVPRFPLSSRPRLPDADRNGSNERRRRDHPSTSCVVEGGTAGTSPDRAGRDSPVIRPPPELTRRDRPKASPPLQFFGLPDCRRAQPPSRQCRELAFAFRGAESEATETLPPPAFRSRLLPNGLATCHDGREVFSGTIAIIDDGAAAAGRR